MTDDRIRELVTEHRWRLMAGFLPIGSAETVLAEFIRAVAEEERTSVLAEFDGAMKEITGATGKVRR